MRQIHASSWTRIFDVLTLLTHILIAVKGFAKLPTASVTLLRFESTHSGTIGYHTTTLRETTTTTTTTNDDNDIFKINVTNHLTGIQRTIDWQAYGPPIPLKKELALLQSGVLTKRGEYNRLEGTRIDEVQKKCHELGMTLSQALLIRKQVLVTKTIKNTWKLEKFHSRHARSYETRRQSIIQLSRDLDLPPVNVFRYLLKRRVENDCPTLRDRDVKIIVKGIINKEENMDRFLASWEVEQLHLAKSYDMIGHGNDTTDVLSGLWERALYDFLDERGVNYMSEDDIRREAGESRYVAATPDCLLLDDCVINGREVRWIDSKNFYASGLKESWHFTKKMRKQINKYDNEFGGSGAVVFKYGFSERLEGALPDTLFLDAGPLI